jgi:hypothetical protein
LSAYLYSFCVLSVERCLFRFFSSLKRSMLAWLKGDPVFRHVSGLWTEFSDFRCFHWIMISFQWLLFLLIAIATDLHIAFSPRPTLAAMPELLRIHLVLWLSLDSVDKQK